MPCDAEHARTLSRQYVCNLHLLETDFTVGDKTRDGQFQIFYSDLTLHFSPTSWRTLREFLILWRIPSCPGPYKNVFQAIPNLSDRRNQPNPLRHLVTFIYIPWHVCMNRNQSFSKEDTSFSLVSANESASGEELGSVKLYFILGGTDSNRCNIQQMVQKSVNPAI